MKRLLLSSASAILGLAFLAGVVAILNTFEIGPRFPVFAGETDMSLRASFFFFLVTPAFLSFGAWIGYRAASSRLEGLWLLLGALGGTVLVHSTLYLLSPAIESITSREVANYSAVGAMALWVLVAIIGSLIARRLTRSLTGRALRRAG